MATALVGRFIELNTHDSGRSPQLTHAGPLQGGEFVRRDSPPWRGPAWIR